MCPIKGRVTPREHFLHNLVRKVIDREDSCSVITCFLDFIFRSSHTDGFSHRFAARWFSTSSNVACGEKLFYAFFGIYVMFSGLERMLEKERCMWCAQVWRWCGAARSSDSRKDARCSLFRLYCCFILTNIILYTTVVYEMVVVLSFQINIFFVRIVPKIECLTN